MREVAVAQLVVVQVADAALGLVHALHLAHQERPAAVRVVRDHVAVGPAGALRVAPLHQQRVGGRRAGTEHAVELLAVGAAQLFEQAGVSAAEVAGGIVAVGDQLIGVQVAGTAQRALQFGGLCGDAQGQGGQQN